MGESPYTPKIAMRFSNAASGTVVRKGSGRGRLQPSWATDRHRRCVSAGDPNCDSCRAVLVRTGVSHRLFTAEVTAALAQASMRAALPSVACASHGLVRSLSPLLSGASGFASTSAMLPAARSRRRACSAPTGLPPGPDSGPRRL